MFKTYSFSKSNHTETVYASPNYEQDIILYLTINKRSYLNLKHPQYFKYFHSLKQLTANPKIEQTLHKRLQTHR